MRFRLLNKSGNKGFTIVEVVISIVIFAGFIGTLMYLYGRSNDSFKITLWKQQRTAQAEIFWSFMRKHLEEATNELGVEPFVDNPDVTVNSKPMKFHPDAKSVGTGNLLAWNSSKVEFNFVPAPNHKVKHAMFTLRKDKNKLELISGKTISRLDDVASVELSVNSVKRGAKNEEFLDPGPDAAAEGTVLDIAIVLAPPEGYLAQDLKIPQNHKFKLNVGSIADPSPTY